MKAAEIIFSPTGGCAKVSGQLIDGLAAQKLVEGEVRRIDLSDRSLDFGTVRVEEDTLCVITVPSFGGRVPGVAVERLKQISADQAKAILVAVYGNREFEDTLLELKDAAAEAGFVHVAAVAALAEHSIARSIAKGRPDAQDCQVLNDFAVKITEKVKAGNWDEVHVPGNRPYKEYGGASAKPEAGETCAGCGLCAAACPVGAIPAEKPSETDKQKCISCMRCIAVCPGAARSVDPDTIAAVTQKLSGLCPEPKENRLYL